MTITTPVFPLGTAYLPGDIVVLNVFEPRYVELFSLHCGVGDSFVSVLIERGSEVGGNDKRCSHGMSVLVSSIENSDGYLVVYGQAQQVVDIIEWALDDPYPLAVVVAQSVGDIEHRDRFDIASSLSLLAQAVRRLIAMLTDADGLDDSDRPVNVLETIAGGRWWDETVSEQDVWRAFWLVSRHVPCGPLDRYALLCPAPLDQRVQTLRHIVEHVTEIAQFRFSE